MALVYPSSILSPPDADTRDAEIAWFIEDLKLVAKVIESLG
jgi:hypothetical protein